MYSIRRKLSIIILFCSILATLLTAVFVNAIINKIEGSGIGLTIVKDVLILHSASIDVESEANKETSFTIRFSDIKI